MKKYINEILQSKRRVGFWPTKAGVSNKIKAPDPSGV